MDYIYPAIGHTHTFMEITVYTTLPSGETMELKSRVSPRIPEPIKKDVIEAKSAELTKLVEAKLEEQKLAVLREQLRQDEAEQEKMAEAEPVQKKKRGKKAMV